MTGTTVVVPADPAPVPELDADPAGVQRFGSDLLSASTQVDDLGTFAASGARVAAWSGDAGTTYHDALRPFGSRADAMSLALRHVGRRAQTHGDRLADLQQRRQTLQGERGRLVGVLERFTAEVDGAPAERVPELRERAQELGRQVRTLESDVRTWQTDLETEERSMREAFRDAGDLDRVEQRWGGVADPADGALATMPGDGASPQEVNDWWEGLTPAERDAIVAASPGSIGNLDGVPAAYRDEANRTALSRDLAELEMLEASGDLTSAEEGLLENARAARNALEDAAARRDPQTDLPVESSLYMYDPGAFGGDGRMALAYGNPDTADHLSVHVPGMTTDMGSATGNGDSAWATYATARSHTLDSVASMMWIGYDAPDNHPFGGGGFDVAQVAGQGLAEDGGERLAQTMDGLDAIRPDDPHTTVVGHSYGSTTVGLGASGPGLETDDIVLIGSPGLGDENDDVGDLGLDDDHVYVGSNSSDPVSQLGGQGWVHNPLSVLGHDPSTDDFGATRIAAEDDQRNEGVDHSIDQHNSYYEQHSESLYNIGQVVIGQGDSVIGADHRYDPWWGGPQDPEADREVTRPDTGDWEP